MNLSTCNLCNRYVCECCITCWDHGYDHPFRNEEWFEKKTIIVGKHVKGVIQMNAIIALRAKTHANTNVSAMKKKMIHMNYHQGFCVDVDAVKDIMFQMEKI